MLNGTPDQHPTQLLDCSCMEIGVALSLNHSPRDVVNSLNDWFSTRTGGVLDSIKPKILMVLEFVQATNRKLPTRNSRLQEHSSLFLRASCW